MSDSFSDNRSYAVDLSRNMENSERSGFVPQLNSLAFDVARREANAASIPWLRVVLGKHQAPMAGTRNLWITMPAISARHTQPFRFEWILHASGFLWT
ncbi:hypothetical protein [Aureimonas psammosilenae]|uniref:hypothetical protein n=1 Tax=Aureimonas psammosilenae TaxID=2495496 RepID=UPI00186A56FA|nr:hypothetical protein [Aureimonas psammosilenae]